MTNNYSTSFLSSTTNFGFRKLLTKSSRLLFIVLLFLFAANGVKAQSQAVAVTGFNCDVVANGSSVTSSVTPNSWIDANGGYYYMDQTYVGGGVPTCYMPAGGNISSSATFGVPYQLASYTSNNCLQLRNSLQTGTLSFVTPATAATVYVLAVCGSGNSSGTPSAANGATATITVNFTDGTSQQFSNVLIFDWFNGSYSAIPTNFGVNRVNGSSGVPDNGGTCTGGNPRLYEIPLALSPANFSKQIGSVTFQKSCLGNTSSATTNQVINVFAITITPPCSAPSTQPSALAFSSINSTSMVGTLTASGSPTGYVVVRYPSGTSTITAPTNNTTYTVGQLLGAGVVAYAGTSTSFTASSLSGGTAYDFYVYAYNSGTTCVGPTYNITSPLTKTQSTTSCAGGLSGAIAIGPSTSYSGYSSKYSTLTQAINALSSAGLSGPVTLELQNDYVCNGTIAEVFPITLSLNTCIGPINTLTIRPAANVTNTLVITSANTLTTIDYNTARYVTIDGRPGGTGTTSKLQIINTNTSSLASVRFINDAQFNKITYCDIQGQQTTYNLSSLGSGVVFIGGTTGTLGNDNNTISYCNIHATSGGNPITGIFAYNSANNGTNSDNDYNTIDNNNVYDFGNSTINQNWTGILLYQGNNYTNITNNKVYEAQTINYAAYTNTLRFIWASPTGGNTVSTYGNGTYIYNNHLGNNSSSGGTACSITFPSTGKIVCMDCNFGYGLPLTQVSTNYIENINFTTANTTTTGTGIFAGIYCGNGNVSITGNTIGGSNSNNIQVTSTYASSGTYVNGIVVTSTTGTGMINGNNGNTSNAPYVPYSYTVTGNFINNITAIGSTTAIYTNLWGIEINGGNELLTVSGNTITNLTNGANTTTATTGQIVGIGMNGSSLMTSTLISGNTISNCTNYFNNISASNTGAAVIGVLVNNTSAMSATIQSNTIYNLYSAFTSTAASLPTWVVGVSINGNASQSTFDVYKNNIHSLNVLNWTPAAGTASSLPNIVGIYQSQGIIYAANNMVRLGIDGNGASITNPISFIGIKKAGAYNGYLWHNSVYIGGTGVSTTLASGTSLLSCAYQRTAVGTVDDVENNIFVNNRSNASSAIGTYHFACYLSSTSAYTQNYNIYQYNGTGGVFAYNVGANVANYSAGWLAGENNSYNSDPMFKNPLGNATSAPGNSPSASTGVNLHINPSVATAVEGNGSTSLAISSVFSDDIDNDIRSAKTPVDIGADAGFFIPFPLCSAPSVQPTNLIPSSRTQTQIVASFNAATPAGSADGYIVVRYLHNATPTAPVGATTYVAGNTFGSSPNIGTVVYVGASTSFTAAGLATNTSYDFYEYAMNVNCTGGPSYNTVSPLIANFSTTACGVGAISGVYPIGPTLTYSGYSNTGYKDITTAIGATGLNLATNGMAGNVVLELQSDYSNSTETYPITFGAYPCASPSSRLIIRPASGVNGKSITNSTITSQPTVIFNGANYVVIDGTPGGTTPTNNTFTSGNNLVVSNTLATGFPAIAFQNDAQNCTVTYTDLQSNNAVAAGTAGAGVVNFGTTTTTALLGNDYDTLSYCNIHNVTGGTTLATGVNGFGTNTNVTSFNDYDVVTNCNIYDCFNAGVSTNALYLGTGTNAWTINQNKFYQSATRSYTTAGLTHRAIYINNATGNSLGSGYNITNNIIGYANSSQTGTYTLSSTGAAIGTSFTAMDISVGVGTATSITGNTFSNFSLSPSSTSTASTLQGIFVNGGGNVNIGGAGALANTIGSASTTGSISFTTASSVANSFFGIRAIAGNLINITNNTISGITLTASSTGSVEAHLLNVTLPTISTITNNTIGGTLANSIQVTNPSGSTVSARVSGLILNPASAITSLTTLIMSSTLGLLK